MVVEKKNRLDRGEDVVSAIENVNAIVINKKNVLDRDPDHESGDKTENTLVIAEETESEIEDVDADAVRAVRTDDADADMVEHDNADAILSQDEEKCDSNVIHGTGLVGARFIAPEETITVPSVITGQSTIATKKCKRQEMEWPKYYFGYGPIVHPEVQSRRGLEMVDKQAAMLPEYMLTFSILGSANVIEQTGYDVYGILMRFDKEEDWAKLIEFEGGSYELDKVKVYPTKTPDDPIMAYTFIMIDYSKRHKGPIVETLPTERYINLIADGMRAYKIDPDYIQDQIMSIPFKPYVKPENYKTYPYISNPLPKITFQKYLDLCGSAEAGSAEAKDTYFIIGKKVIKLDKHNPKNPVALWARNRGHGQPDITLCLHRTVVELELHMAYSVKELTPAHFAWAEQILNEYHEGAGLRATVMFQLCDPEEEGPRIVSPGWCSCWWWKNKKSSTM